MAAAYELKDADPTAEPLHVISWLLDTSVLHLGHGFVVVASGSGRPASTCEEHYSRQQDCHSRCLSPSGTPGDCTQNRDEDISTLLRRYTPTDGNLSWLTSFTEYQ